MQINITTSAKNKEVVQRLTKALQIREENIIARIAIAYSLANNRYLKLEDIQSSKDGKSYKEQTLFGEHRDLYIGLMCQHYGIDKSNPDLPKYFKLHLDDGLELLDKTFKDRPDLNMFDFLLQALESGIESLSDNEDIFEPVANNHLDIKSEIYEDIVKLKVGYDIENNNEVIIEINNTQKYNNAHIAVAGESGSGKTQFALELLKQFYLNSNKTIKFLYLDFKGLKKGDENSELYRKFFTETDTRYINVTQEPFPLNPLSFIDTINEQNKILGINKLVNIISEYGNIGENQEQILKQAVKDAFSSKRPGEYPSFKEIYDFVYEMENKYSRLTKILNGLQELEIFKTEVDPYDSFINNNYYLSLSGDLPEEIQFVATFLIINYIYNIFMNLPKAPINNDIIGLRYILLIDEAHVIFRNKKSQLILEKILREIRSQGVSVVLLSQGINEFNQPSFDFSSMCNTSFLLKIKDLYNKKAIEKFLGYTERDYQKSKKSLEKLSEIKAGAITNIREYEKGKLIRLVQFYENLL